MSKASELLGTRKPTKKEAKAGAEIVFIREDKHGSISDTVEIMGATCHESWEQWGAPTDYLSDNVDDIEAWRRTKD